MKIEWFGGYYWPIRVIREFRAEFEADNHLTVRPTGPWIAVWFGQGLRIGRK